MNDALNRLLRTLPQGGVAALAIGVANNRLDLSMDNNEQLLAMIVLTAIAAFVQRVFEVQGWLKDRTTKGGV